MKNIYLFLFSLLLSQAMLAQQSSSRPNSESDYYSIQTLPIPEGVVLEVGGLALMPNGDLAASTRRGEVWLIENPYMKGGSYPHYQRYASGMHEILGLAHHQGTLYLAQRGELTRLWDKNGDKVADYYESVFSWPLSGHYHEYSYGPVIDPEGNMFVSGNVAFGDAEWWRGESRVPWRGWVMQITPEGEMNPWATGMRSPCGLGMIDGELFYGDNQGDWMGSGGLVHVSKGDFTGHPAGLRWSQLPGSPVNLKTEELYAHVDPRLTPAGATPIKIQNDTSGHQLTLFEVAEKVPAIKTPAVWLPHGVLGISTSEVITDKTEGAFGPFAGQLLIGDQGQSKIVRVFLEKINGEYQGAAFSFLEGFRSGVLRLCWGKDGSLFVGQTNRGWGSTGPEMFGLERVVWNGRTPFEMKAIRAMPDGFEIEFTQPVDKVKAADPASYAVGNFIYKYHPVYGSPAINDESCDILGVVVSKDGLKARIVVDNLREHYIHEIKVLGVTSYYDDAKVLHPTAYYTLKSIPEGQKLNFPKKTKPASHSHHSPPPVKESSKAPARSTSVKTSAPKAKPATAEKLAKRQTSQPKSWTSGPDQTIILGTKPGLKYDKPLIIVKAGSKIKWSFNNVDDMAHNCVIVPPGAADEVGDAALNMGVKGLNASYIPKNDKVLFHTNLMQPGSSESIYFVAPSKPGNYTFVCTVPGHAKLMRGTLRVLN